MYVVLLTLTRGQPSQRGICIAGCMISLALPPRHSNSGLLALTCLSHLLTRMPTTLLTASRPKLRSTRVPYQLLFLLLHLIPSFSTLRTPDSLSPLPLQLYIIYLPIWLCPLLVSVLLRCSYCLYTIPFPRPLTGTLKPSLLSPRKFSCMLSPLSWTQL